MTDLKKRIKELEPWFQKIDFGGGVSVGRWRTAEMFELLTKGFDLNGKTFFDIGAMSGASMLLAEKRGAVCCGVDPEPRAVKQMALVKEVLGARFHFAEGSVYELPDDTYDFVYMTGVYYHLKHPLLGIEEAWARTRGTLFIEGEILYGEQGCYARFYPKAYKGDGSNWNVPTVECFNAWVSTLSGVGSCNVIYPMVTGERIGAVISRP